jgi:hypothetical protein
MDPTLTEQAGAQPAQVPDPSNNGVPSEPSDPPTVTLRSILNSLHKTISELQHAVAGPEKTIEQGTKNGPFKARRFGLKKDSATQDPLAGM